MSESSIPIASASLESPLGEDVRPSPNASAVPVSVRPHPQEGEAELKSRIDDPFLLMPHEGPLVDRYARVHDDLRISVTDRCNLRCVYCMPEVGMTFQPREALLSFEEIERVATVAFEMGVTSLRLTGGEPLVRKNVVNLVSRLSAIGFKDLAMTTNGMLLSPVVQALGDAGLKRVNISCDSLREVRFNEIRRRGDLNTVLSAMDAAESAGLSPLKVNVVILRGENDDEILDFARFARDTGRVVRFIEFMPLDAQGHWEKSQLVPGHEIFERINAVWPLVATDVGGSAPAERFKFADGQGEVGLISSVTQPFCGTCNRLRLTADGAIRNCLFSDNEFSLRDLMRDGGGDDEVALLLRKAVWEKYPGHAINEPGFLRPTRSMSMIGG
ncbi:MAG TPA: GTP 3',8-cyclase MoaA [Acidimicrobiales bacterium]|nr:GTP 3',8-cyclase MoaA [Acidimicrobiales bacterium]